MLNNKKNIVISIIVISTFCLVLGFNILRSDKEYVVVESKEEINVVDNEEEILSDDVDDDFVTVYISGEVNNPQVISIENGKRLVDAVEYCGGLTKDADTNAINLAMILKEENHYIIPAIGESMNVNPLNQNNAITESYININTASLDELKNLPGVGDVLAQRIIDKREELGKFSSVDELKDVSGIGDKKFSDIKDMVGLN